MSLNNFLIPGSEKTGMIRSSFSRCIKWRTENGRTRRKLRRPQRTSTPVDCRVNTSTPATSESYFKSMSELLYQSWKNELNSCEEVKSENELPTASTFHDVNFVYNYYNLYCNWCPTQVVFVTTITPYVVLPVTYPAVGYRSDGTYGVLPLTWCSYYT